MAMGGLLGKLAFLETWIVGKRIEIKLERAAFLRTMAACRNSGAFLV
jgi:hypothetical protein